MKQIKPKSSETPSIPAPPTEFWRPDLQWHLKALGAIYLFVLIFYFAVDHWLSRLPEPYRLREVPQEMTPWLKK